MTRKRFIKLLMAEGYQPREAEARAWTINGTGLPYADAYAMHLMLYDPRQRPHNPILAGQALEHMTAALMQQLRPALASPSRALSDMCLSLSDTFAAMADRFEEEAEDDEPDE